MTERRKLNMKSDNAGHQSAVIVVFLDIIGINALAIVSLNLEKNIM